MRQSHVRHTQFTQPMLYSVKFCLYEESGNYLEMAIFVFNVCCDLNLFLGWIVYFHLFTDIDRLKLHSNSYFQLINLSRTPKFNDTVLSIVCVCDFFLKNQQQHQFSRVLICCCVKLSSITAVIIYYWYHIYINCYRIRITSPFLDSVLNYVRAIVDWDACHCYQ